MSARAPGMALVLVLWLITLLTASITTVVFVARVEALQSSTLRTAAQDEEIARAAVEYALWRIQSGNQLSSSQRRWFPDGRVYHWIYSGVQVDIRIQDETGKIDLNLADQNLLASLIRVVSPADDSADQAQKIAGAIIDWRDADNLTALGGGAEEGDYAAAQLPYHPSNAPFETVSQLRWVLGVGPGLYQRLMPYVTVYGGNSQPDSQYSPAPILTALGQNARTVLAQRQETLANMTGGGVGSGAYSIETRVHATLSRQTALTMTVRVGAGRLPDSTYTVLHWQQGAGEP